MQSLRRLAPLRGAGRAPAGASAVEMAFVLPLLLTIVFACLDYGRAIYASIALTNVARIGAEYGATHRFVAANRAAWEAQIRTAATDEATSIPGYSADDLDVAITTTNDAGGTLYVVVAAEYDFRTIVRWPGMPNILALRHQVGMRQYQ
jgi:Flp pilus assembly protein TadG